ncbi:hypothetical protein P4689_29610, partial [Priestia megaterium]|uniref:hypothetical protein n=1 Tax=Priestia megaterium TaxID=1404 RepID=UPI002E229F57|nr:hypothetical protein [Priestia megaterium]
IKDKKIAITEGVVIKIAKYKFYYMLNNAKNVRTKKRREYRDVQYNLGQLRDGFDTLQKQRPDLYCKLLQVVRVYLESGMLKDLAPTIHRTKKHYEWETIDILPSRLHKEMDSAKETIVKIHPKLGILASNGKDKSLKPLTMEILIEQSKGRQFPSVTKAFKFIESEYGITLYKAKKLIDTAESVENEKGKIEILKLENKEQVLKIKLNQNREWMRQRYPQFINTTEKLVSIFKGASNEHIEFILKISKVKRQGYIIKRVNSSNLKIKSKNRPINVYNIKLILLNGSKSRSIKEI